jgi:hypothetical protein
VAPIVEVVRRSVQAYRYQLGPIREVIPALGEAFRSVSTAACESSPERIRPGGSIAFADSKLFVSTSTSGPDVWAGFCQCPVVELGHVDGDGVPTSVAGK